MVKGGTRNERRKKEKNMEGWVRECGKQQVIEETRSKSRKSSIKCKVKIKKSKKGVIKTTTLRYRVLDDTKFASSASRSIKS